MLQESPGALRRRLFNPKNAVRDTEIDLRPRFKTETPVKKPDEPHIAKQKQSLAEAIFEWNCRRYFDACFNDLAMPYAQPEQPKRPTIERIIRTVAERFGIMAIDIVSERRTQNVVRPRQIAMWLAKTITTASLPEIGRRIGKRDHTTILHGVKKIERLRASEPETKTITDELLYLLRPVEKTEGADAEINSGNRS